MKNWKYSLGDAKYLQIVTDEWNVRFWIKFSLLKFFHLNSFEGGWRILKHRIMFLFLNDWTLKCIQLILSVFILLQPTSSLACHVHCCYHFVSSRTVITNSQWQKCLMKGPFIPKSQFRVLYLQPFFLADSENCKKIVAFILFLFENLYIFQKHHYKNAS